MEPLLSALLRPEAYDHPVGRLQLLQTHISWIVLTGPYAYKIKKPLDLGFVDFSTLARRRHFCQEELRLNQRLSPELYLAVVEIHGPPSRACLRGDGPVVEVAVRMHQFRQEDLLPAVLRRAQAAALLADPLAGLAERLAVFHAAADRRPPEPAYGTAALVRQPAEANLTLLEQLLGDDPRLPPLRRWCALEGQRLQALFTERRDQGWVREGHGDLHLGNLVLSQGRISPFDCLEFSPSLRWIDVISDVAFLAMDLCRHRRSTLAALMLNRWLEYSGDYGGLRLWRWYLAYRALVRAKVTALRLAAPEVAAAGERRRWRADLRAYLAVAQAAARPSRPLLLITHGLSGSGKSHWAARLARRQGWLHIRSDLERLRLFGRWGEPLATPLSGDAYRPEVSAHLYRQHLPACCESALQAGFSVICDATFLRHEQRLLFRQLAHRLEVGFLILACHASVQLAQQRILDRLVQGEDPSEADAAVLEAQRLLLEPLRPDERACAVQVGSHPPVEVTMSVSGDAALDELVRRLAHLAAAAHQAG